MHRNLKHLPRLATVLAVAALALGGTAQAQRSTTQRSAASSSAKRSDADNHAPGLALGIYTLAAPGVSISGQDVDGTFNTTMGEGVGVLAEYGLNRTWSLFASLDVAKQATGQDVTPSGTMGLAHFEIGGRAKLHLADPKTVPYLTAAVGRRALGARVTDQDTGNEVDFSMTGGMFALGGGVERVISPKLALDGGIEFGFGSFDHYSLDGDRGTSAVNSSTSVRLRFGLNWHP